MVNVDIIFEHKIDHKRVIIEHTNETLQKVGIIEEDIIAWGVYLAYGLVLNNSKYKQSEDLDVQISINRRKLHFVFKTTNDDQVSLFKIGEQHYSLFDKESGQYFTKCRAQITNMLKYTDSISFIDFERFSKRSPEISTPMGGAVKKK